MFRVTSMSPEQPWGSNLDFVDSELESLFADERVPDRRLSVMLRPAGDRKKFAKELRETGATEVELLATESLSARIPPDSLKSLMQSSRLEAVELVRPVQVFDSGN